MRGPRRVHAELDTPPTAYSSPTEARCLQAPLPRLLHPHALLIQPTALGRTTTIRAAFTRMV
jgi:hypothetical protein